MFDEIHEILEKYRPHFREKYKTEGKEFQQFEGEDNMVSFGLMMWISRDKGIKHFENLVIDKPEELLKIMADRIKSTIGSIMEHHPDKEKAMQIIIEGLGAKAEVLSGYSDMKGDHKDICDDPSCPVHGKDGILSVLKKKTEKPIGVA